VHNLYLQQGIGLAAATEIVLRCSNSRNSMGGPFASDTKLDSLKAWCPRRWIKLRMQCKTEITRRMLWSAHTRIPLTRMKCWYKPDLTYGIQSRVGIGNS